MVAEGYAVVGPRSAENARTLLALAEGLGLDPGVVRTTIGGYIVPESVGRKYEESLGAPPEENAVETEPEEDEKSDFPDESWHVNTIKKWAKDHGIDLGDATRKADLLAAIQAHEEE